MRAVMISVKPEWVQKILNGEKTIEIRKTMPKCELPCKVYIYCTKSKPNLCDRRNADVKLADFEFVNNLDSDDILLNGKVVAEFTLRTVTKFDYLGVFYDYKKEELLKKSCLTDKQLADYVSPVGYAWHIDDLKIYDRPKELSEFDRPEIDLTSDETGSAVCPMFAYKKLTKAPQSWCYVEELGEK